MQVTVLLWMMTWSNTLVYSCECVCFVSLYCLVNVFFFCVLCCLMFIVMFHIQLQLIQTLVLAYEWIFHVSCIVLSDVYCHVPYSDATDAETGSLEWIVCTCVWKTRVQVYEHYRLKHEYLQNCSNNVVRYHISLFTFTTINQSMGFASN